ncbi:MAG: EamA family transporter [Bacteroidia bacterium]|nr:EamA family transporter [Bacteroidia bacterium]
MNTTTARARFQQARGSNKVLAWVILIFLALVWGSSFILIKRGLESFSAMQVGGLRLVIAGIFVTPLIWGKFRKIKKEEWKWILLVGVIGNALPAVLFPLAETHLNSASAGVLNVMSPIFVLLFGVALFGFRFTTLQVIGVALGFGGVLMLILLGDQSVNLLDHVLYAGAAVLATVGYGLSTNVMKRYLGRVPTTLAPSFALFFMAIPYAIYLLLWADLGAVFEADAAHAWQSFSYIALLGILGTAISLVLFYKLIQITEPIVAASVTYLIPIVALFWGWMDGESLTSLQYLGMAVIIAGVYLVNRKKT